MCITEYQIPVLKEATIVNNISVIYCSRVDQGGLAESHGITVGDQIIDVNGVTTENATHAQAVELIRNQRCLIMTIRSVNRYPAYKELCNDYEWPVRDTHPKRKKDMQLFI